MTGMRVQFAQNTPLTRREFFQSWRERTLSRLSGRALPEPQQRVTTVAHEPEAAFQFGVPHHFTVLNTATGDEIACVDFQKGPVKENGVNGVTNEDLLSMVIARLEGFQASAFASPEGAAALRKIRQGLAILNARTARREARGVEGTSRK